MRVKAIKKRLFKKYRANLKLVAEHCIPEYKQRLLAREILLCPICLMPFEQTQIKMPADKSNYLTLEHVPPKYLGWTAEVLTCHICNNGSSQKDKNLQYLSANPHLRRRIMTVKSQDVQLRALTTFNTESNVVEFLFNNDEDIKKLVESTKETKGFNFTFEDDTPALGGNVLKIAYLLAFHKFGYGLIFHPSYNILRQHILKPYEEHIKNFGSVKLKSQSNDLPDGVFLVKEPKALSSLLIRFTTNCTVKGKIQTEVYTIHIPSPTANVAEFYKLLDETSKGAIYRISNFNDGIDFWHDRKYIFGAIEEIDKHQLKDM